MSFLQELKRETAERRAATEADYKALLAKAGTLDGYRRLLADDDADGLADLRAAMAELNITAADVEADVAAMAAHATAATAVMTDAERADAQAKRAAEWAAVRREVRAAATDLLDGLPNYLLTQVFGSMYIAALTSARGADRDRVVQFDHVRDWDARTRIAEQQLKDREQRSTTAAATLARLSAAHPRMLGDASTL